MSLVLNNNSLQLAQYTGPASEVQSQVLKLQAHKGAVLTNKFNKDGDLIASGGVDKKVIIWKLSDILIQDRIVEEIPFEYEFETIHKSAITSIKWSNSNDNLLFSSSADSTASVFDITKGRKIKTFKHNACVNEIDNSKRDTIVTCSDDSAVKIWDLRSRFPVNTITAKFPILTTCIDNNENRLYFSGVDPTVFCYDLRNLSNPNWMETNHSNTVTSLSLSPITDISADSQSRLISKSLDNTIKSYDSRLFIKGSRSKPYIFDGAKGSEDDLLIRCKLFKQGGKDYIVSGSNDGFIYVWDFVSRKLTNRLDGHFGTVLDVDYSQGKNMLITCSIDGSIILRDM